MRSRGRIVCLVACMLLAGTSARAWDDATGDRDMPWMGNGERARLFTKQSVCMMCPTGYRFQQRWGRSGRSGAEPYGTVGSALRFLQERGVLGAWPEAIAEGSVSDGKEIIDPRAAPYRLTVVMIEPTVVVMRFDLGALVKVGGPDNPEQTVGTPRLNQSVSYGTHLPAAGTLLWFSPDAGRLPTPVTLVGPERGEIVVERLRLGLERRAGEWIVSRPVRTD